MSYCFAMPFEAPLWLIFSYSRIW